MRQDKIKMKAKLNEIGKLAGLDDYEIEKAKRTKNVIISTCIIAVIITFIGIFTITRLEAIGLWYIPSSIKDFSFLSRFF